MVDAGDFAWKSPRVPAQRLPQQQRKAKLQLDAFGMVGMDALTPGDGDLALGPGWLAARAAEAGVPLVLSNVSCDGAELPRAVRVRKGEVDVVVVGILGPSLRVPAGCSVTPPAEALRDALAGAGATDLVVLLSHQDPADDNALAEAVPAIDLVVNAGSGASYVEPRALPGGALQLAAGSQGKKLGVATLTLQPGASGFASDAARQRVAHRVDRNKERLELAREQAAAAADGTARARAERRVEHFEAEATALEAELAALVDEAGPARNQLEHEHRALGEEVADHPATAALLAAALPEIEAAASSAAGVVAPDEAKGPFVGTRACERCHPAQAAQWRGTPHAHAWDTLTKQGRQLDLDCWSCHATGATHPGGPQHPTEVGSLKHVGCEACHGPGEAHVTAPSKANIQGAPGESTCIGCHDGAKDEGRFDLDAYLPRVDHRGAAPR